MSDELIQNYFVADDTLVSAQALSADILSVNLIDTAALALSAVQVGIMIVILIAIAAR